MILPLLMATVLSYGSWSSPITSDLISEGAIAFQEVACEGKQLYWTEMRPAEKGRVALLSLAPNGAVRELAPSLNVVSRVHEYGGGALTVAQGVIYFVNSADQQIYIVDKDGPVALTHEKDRRFADMVISPNGKVLYSVCEEHRSDGVVDNYLVAIPLQGAKKGKVHIIASGRDFYSSPRLSSDGSMLAWISWDNPNMPWDGTRLWTAAVKDDGALGEPIFIAGGDEESITQPQWAPDGTLYFISDRSGWWNFYSWKAGRTDALYPMEAECAVPAWLFARNNYLQMGGGKLLFSYFDGENDRLALLYPKEKRIEKIDLPFTVIRNLCGGSQGVLFLGASPTQPSSIVQLDPASMKWTIVKQSFSINFDPSYISKPKLITYPSSEGRPTYAFYYPPTNPKYQAPEGELPPLLVKSHGGPTAHTQNGLSLDTQFWTSRGIAVVDVNYGGSTGYGRAYRKRLEGMWGVVDVEDCVNAAKYLAGQDKADPKRLAIRGGSAGGYTTLCALTFYKVFACGTSYYGVSDLELLVKDTHKFEARYLDRLVAPYPSGIEVYKQRSPIDHVQNITCPVLLLQGKDDPVVPPNQTEEIFEALKKRGVPVAMILFDSEKHGFKIAANIKRALDAELYFYSQILKFRLADFIAPVLIENFKVSP